MSDGNDKNNRQQVIDLFKEANKDIERFWQRDLTLAASPEGFLVLPLDIVKKPPIRNHNYCPSCGSSNTYYRRTMGNWICHKCSSVFLIPDLS